MTASIIASTKMPCRGECGKEYQKLDLYMLMCRACFRKAYLNTDMYFPAHFGNIVRTLEESLTDECVRLHWDEDIVMKKLDNNHLGLGDCYCKNPYLFFSLNREEAESTGLSMHLYDTYRFMFREAYENYHRSLFPRHENYFEAMKGYGRGVQEMLRNSLTNSPLSL
jgi:hypothetical protein